MALMVFLQNPEDEFHYLLTHAASALRDNFICKDIESKRYIFDYLFSIRQRFHLFSYDGKCELKILISYTK